MKIYAVREAGTYKFHGIFWAKSAADLWDAVDEMGDPAFFEYAKIRRPGGLWHGKSNDETTATGQIGDIDDESDSHFMHPLEHMGELLGEMLFTMDRHIWTPFDTANEGVGLVARAMKEARKKGGT